MTCKMLLVRCVCTVCMYDRIIIMAGQWNTTHSEWYVVLQLDAKTRNTGKGNGDTKIENFTAMKQPTPRHHAPERQRSVKARQGTTYNDEHRLGHHLLHAVVPVADSSQLLRQLLLRVSAEGGRGERKKEDMSLDERSRSTGNTG